MVIEVANEAPHQMDAFGEGSLITAEFMIFSGVTGTFDLPH